MTADQTPLSPEPGPDAGIDDIQADIEHTRKELGETIGALSAQGRRHGPGEAESRRHQGPRHRKGIRDKGPRRRKGPYAAQSAARDAVTDSTGSVKPGVSIAALIAAAAIVAISVAVWRRRR